MSSKSLVMLPVAVKHSFFTLDLLVGDSLLSQPLKKFDTPEKKIVRIIFYLEKRRQEILWYSPFHKFLPFTSVQCTRQQESGRELWKDVNIVFVYIILFFTKIYVEGVWQCDRAVGGWGGGNHVLIWYLLSNNYIHTFRNLQEVLTIRSV